MNNNEQKIIDAMHFMREVLQLERVGVIKFTQNYDFDQEDGYKLFEVCHEAWREYEGPINWFPEFVTNWLKNRQVELDALEELKKLSTLDMPTGHTWEYCPFCNQEVVIPAYKASFCPNCGRKILPCSTCPTEEKDCSHCLFDELNK